VRLTWNRSIDTGSGMLGYKVYRGGALISGASPIANATYDDTGLAYSTSQSYTITAIDNANNASVATNAFNITTDRELLVQDNLNRLDGSLGSPWTVNLGAAFVYAGSAMPGFCGSYEMSDNPPPPLTFGGLSIASLRSAPGTPGLFLNAGQYDEVDIGGMLVAVWWPVTWAPLVWSQAALTPSTYSFKGSVEVTANTSAAGFVLFTQAATGAFTDPAGVATTYTSSKGYRALLTGGSALLQYCTDLNYPGAMANVCSTVASAAGVSMTGTFSVETTASTGNIKLYVNGTLKLNTTISASAMTGGIGLVTLDNYSSAACPRTYNFATLDNFLLERN
jgi:hypothetical protein